tara:strand:- start:8501 stop:9538 length:1038 start_codon:yes stop_codon:yes gene_type:complete
MKVYEIRKKNDAPNVFGISLVATPAMESDYVMLSKDIVDNLTLNQKIELSKQNDVKFSEINKEKRLLLGLVLEPNKLIYRYDQAKKEEYYITVSEETILELQQDYIKQSNQSYSTLEHDGKELDGVTFTEHWIVEDSNIDKSALHGLSFKKGSWVTVAKIENESLWNDYVKTGEVMGFSIDAMVQLEEVNNNNNKQLEMSEQKQTLAEFAKDVVNEIRVALHLEKKEEVKEVELAEDEEVVTEVVPEPTEEVEPKSEIEEVKDDLEKIKQVFKEMGIELSSTIKDALKPVNDANIALKKEVETLEAKVVELGELPASVAIKTAPKQVDFSKMNNREKMIHNRENR